MSNIISEAVERSRREEQEFRAFIPQHGFIADYLKYTDTQESPGSFHFWAASAIISAVLQRNVWVSKNIYQVYPNLFVVLVAPSGICRKSRAINIGVGLLEDFSFVNCLADKTTPEALLESLMLGTEHVGLNADKNQIKFGPESHTGFATASELTVFLSKDAYNSSMIEILTDLYDCRSNFKYVTRNKRPIILKNTCLSILGGSTPDWIANLPPDAFGGGFMSRFIFMVKNCRDRSICFPQEPPKGLQQKLKETLAKIHASCQGKMIITQEAKIWFQDWYDRLSDQARNVDTQLLGFVERKPDTVLKVATILATSELRMTIHKEDLQTAYAVVTWTQERAFDAFRHVEMTRFGNLKMRIIEFLDHNGGYVNRREILRKFGGRLQNLKELEGLESLMEASGELQIERSEGKGRPSIFYRRLFSDA